MAEIASNFSPYTYTNNNPINFIDPDGMAVTGDYYKTDGTYLGNDGIDDDKAYVVKDGGVVSTDRTKPGIATHTIKKNSIVDLGVTHSQLLSFSAVIDIESSGSKNESYAIGNVTMNFLASGGSSTLKTLEDVTMYDNTFAQGATQKNLCDFLGLTPKEQNSKFAIGAAINAIGYSKGMAGFSDISNGANSWDGLDLVVSSWSNPHRNYSWSSSSKDLLSTYKKDNKGGVDVSKFVYKDSGYQISARSIVGKTIYTSIEGGRG